MGYRSEVAYTIRFILDENEKAHGKVREGFYTFLAEAKAKQETQLCFNGEEPMNEKEPSGDGFFVDEKKMQINFFATHVKWYSDYPDVKCHEKLFELAQEWADDEATGNPYIGGVFVRVGESNDDVVEECFGTGDYDWLSVTREINKDWL